MSQICRMCLKTSQNHKCEYISVNRTDNNGVAIATLVKTLIPEMYLGLSLNPVICQPCYDALRDAYSFRLQCLRSENLISIYMRETRCSSVTIVLQDVIDYWMDVYKNKPCQTAVARANLEDWFGLDTSDIHPDNERSYNRRKTKLSKGDEQDVPQQTTNKKETPPIEEGQPVDKNIEQDPLAGPPDPEEISNGSIIELLLGNYRVEVEKIESDNEEEKSALRVSQEPTEKVIELETDEILIGSSDSDEDVSSRKSQEVCGCPSISPCPSLNQPQNSLARRRVKESHDDCVVLCEYRHLEHCKYFRPPTTGKIRRVRKRTWKPKRNIQVSPTPIKKHKTDATKAAEAEIGEKPLGDMRATESIPIDDVDEENLFEELQKCYKAGKFGFSEDFSNLKECFVLKKFFDPTDNSFSYALLPKKTGDHGETPAEPLSSLSDAYLVFKSRDLIDGEKPEGKSPISRDSVDCQSEGGETKVGSKDESNNALDGPSEAKQMPLIRVRPVSTLQKVRTLNHELFPLSTEADRAATPRTVVVHPVRHTPLVRSSTPPLVLNASVVSNLKNVLVPVTCPSPPPPNNALRTVRKTYSKPAEEVAQRRIKAKAKSRIEGSVPIELVHHVSGGKITAVALTACGSSEGSAKNNAEPSASREEDAIDIKEEPLDYADDQVSNELQVEDVNDDSVRSGETTRSSSETSLLEKFANENISQLIGNIPDVGEEEFDEPEYVHINKVSFADITKLMKESKQMKQELKQKIENNRPVEPVQDSKTARRKSRLWKVGRRVRIVPVADEEDTELPARKRQRTLVKTVERTVSDPNSDNKDVCVLFTNFTSEGDYINDHDYLINPYMRNNMSIVRKSGTLNCACLLCNLIHPAKEHIKHMKCHGTKCVICEIDFHNVFILNLHARAHVSYCKLCHVTVTYSRYLHHTVNHNRLLEQAKKSTEAKNIEADPTFKPPPPLGGRKHGGGAGAGGGAIRRGSRRGGRRSTRPRHYKDLELDEEEACIYDKATKSFVTPSVLKQGKQQCQDATSANSANATQPPEGEAAEDAAAALEFVNIAELKPNTSNINVNIAKEPVPENDASDSTKSSHSHTPRRKYQKRKRAVRPADAPQSPEKTETVVRIEESSASTCAAPEAVRDPEPSEKKRKESDSESDCDDITVASMRRRLSLRRRCPQIVPKTSASIRQRRTRAKKSHQQLGLVTTGASDLAAAVDAIISPPPTVDVKLEPEETAPVKRHKSLRGKWKLPASRVSGDAKPSRSRENANSLDGMELKRLAKNKKPPLKSTSPDAALTSGNKEELTPSVNPPEPPSSEALSVVENTTTEKNSLEGADTDQCPVPSDGAKTNCV